MNAVARDEMSSDDEGEWRLMSDPCDRTGGMKRSIPILKNLPRDRFRPIEVEPFEHHDSVGKVVPMFRGFAENELPRIWAGGKENAHFSLRTGGACKNKREIGLLMSVLNDEERGLIRDLIEV